jgi:hypothetical protein
MRLPAFTSVAALFVFTAATPVFAAHIHCATEAYVAGPSAISSPSTPAAITGAANSFQLLVNLPAPTLGTPSCAYEISDILSVTVHIETDQTVTFNNLILDGLAQGPFAVGASLSATVAYGAFPLHQNPGAIERTAPGLFVITLTGKSNDVTITQSSATITGIHYYVPEPATLALSGVALGLIGMFRGRRLAGRK